MPMEELGRWSALVLRTCAWLALVVGLGLAVETAHIGADTNKALAALFAVGTMVGTGFAWALAMGFATVVEAVLDVRGATFDADDDDNEDSAS